MSSDLTLFKKDPDDSLIGYDYYSTHLQKGMSIMTDYLQGVVTKTITSTLGDAKTQQIKELLVSLGASNQKCKHLQNDILTLQKEIDSLKSDHTVLDKKNKTLVSENTVLGEKIKMLESKVSLLTTKLDETNTDLQQAKAEAQAERKTSNDWWEKWKGEKVERQKYERWWHDDAHLRRKAKEEGCILS